MKKLLFPVIIISVLIACKGKTIPLAKDSTLNPSAATNPSQQLIEKFKPFINGVWVKSDYIEDVEKTKSPYKSHGILIGTAAIEINLDSLKADTLSAGFSLNNHEGGAFTILFKMGQKPNSLKTYMIDYDNQSNFYDLGYNVKNYDTSLVLYHYNKNKHIIDSIKYSRVLNFQRSDDAGYGIDYITDKKLIAGRYTGIDSVGNSLKVEFSDEGSVSGFLDFKKYVANTDFIAGPENNLDQMYFDVYTKKQKMFLFKLNADTLKLFESKISTDSTLLVFGKLKYKLVRQK